MESPYKNVGVVGAGTMGIGLGLDLAAHGAHVVLVDRSREQLDRARAEIAKSVRTALLLNKKFPRIASDEVLERIRFTLDLEDARSCDFIVENIVEDVQAKKEVYRHLDALSPPGVCFAVNTSCISITELASVTKRPDKMVGMHFMNPVYLKTAVEVIRGHHTSDATIEAATTLLEQLQKSGIVVNDLPGFVSNRISHLFMNEAAFVVQDQVADPKAVDEIFKRCYGHAMGPLATADLIGLDTVVHSLDVLYQSYQDPKFRCCPLLRKMVHAGLTGVKSGRGFYVYERS